MARAAAKGAAKGKGKASPAKKSPAKRASPTKARGGKAAGKAAGGKSPRKQKRAKDPNAPKRAMSAYMFWLKENRGRIAKPGMSVIDVSRQAGVEWNAVKDKSKWNAQAAKDKNRYTAAMAAYRKK